MCELLVGSRSRQESERRPSPRGEHSLFGSSDTQSSDVSVLTAAWMSAIFYFSCMSNKVSLVFSPMDSSAFKNSEQSRLAGDLI